MAPVITPQQTVEAGAERMGIAVGDLRLPPLAVVAWHRRVVESLADATGATQAEHWFHGDEFPLWRAQVAGREVAITLLRVGAPATVMTMESMVVCGTRAFLGIGFAGSLQRRASIGTCIIPTECVSEEGTSPHYVDADSPITASRRLTEALANACREESASVFAGPLWTTDAPYRELSSKVESYREQGVLGVDMETSAMYALGLFRGVEVCNLLVVSDELWDGWRHAFATPRLRAAQERAERVVLRCLRSGLDV